MRILGTVASSSREVPNAPTIGTATDVGTGRAYNNGAATVTFTAPTFNGGLPILDYTVTSSPGGFTATGAGSPLTVTGLASSTSYTFTVKARNAVGLSAASSASNSITATTVPQAPTIGAAADGGTGTTATVAYTANATGGKAVSVYTATSSPGSLTGTGASPITVSGLTTGTAYTFTVTATNANGTSTASAASNSVTPASPSSYESIATATPSGVSTVTFSSIPGTYKSLQIRISTVAASGNYIKIRFNGSTSGYAWHYLYGSGTTVAASNITGATEGRLFGANLGTDTTFPTVAITDIIDYASTTKNKVSRTLSGLDKNGSGDISLFSNLWVSTAAVTSVTVFTDNTNFNSGTTIALYGVK